MLREAVPESRMTYRLGYFMITATFSTMTAMVPATCLYKPCTQTYADFGICDSASSKSILLLLYLFIISSFYVLQGSDPGYILADDLLMTSDDNESAAYVADSCSISKADDRKSPNVVQQGQGRYESALIKGCAERSPISSDKVVTVHLDSIWKKNDLSVKGREGLKNLLGYEEEECYNAQIRCSEVTDPSEEEALLKSYSHTTSSSADRSSRNVPSATSPVDESDDDRNRQNIKNDFKPGGPEGPLHYRNANRNVKSYHGRKRGKPRGENQSNVESGSDNDETRINDCSSYELYCKYCEMSVPLRSHHCNTCQRCVATFDHHCQVIGTCIGERNHCRFYSFIILNLLGVWILSYISDSAFTPVSVTDTVQQLQYPPPHKPELAYISSAVLAVTWWYILFLFLYHTWLVFTGSTGYECIKSTSSSGNPQSQSDACDAPYSGRQVFDNVYSFCCIRDGLISVLTRSTWKPFTWRKPAPRPRTEDTDCQDNYCRNKHYSCC